VASHFTRPERSIRFNPGKAVKVDLIHGDQLFVGLNCFEPGQSQPSHTHTGADKFYYVLTGRASAVVGDETREVDAGTLIWAPAGVVHGISDVMEPTVMLVAISPPPAK
jgi:quercetin dioxygenase-like cupin family protein